MKKYFFQDAKTGKFVSEKYADKHPDTTIKHSYEKKTNKK